MRRESIGALDCGGEAEKASHSLRGLSQENVSPDLLRSLTVIYPDVEPGFLHQTCLRFHSRPAEIQTFLEEAESQSSLPARSTRRVLDLEAACSPDCEKVWRCPGCDSWQIIKLRPGQEISCSCGQFCSSCDSPSHKPFACRSSQKLTPVEDTEEVGVFRRLTGNIAGISHHRELIDCFLVVADDSRGSVKIFNLTPKNIFTFSHPLDSLFATLAGDFLRNTRIPAQKKTEESVGGGSKKARGSNTVGTRILDMSLNMSLDRTGIQYVENEALRSRFLYWKKYFQAKGIPDGERLVFHGTKAANIDSIIENGLLLSMCRRQSYGPGLYFSDIPQVALSYGPALVVCRVMLGRPYRGREKKERIPDGFNSKIVEKQHFIIVGREEQILPAFIIREGASFKDLI